MIRGHLFQYNILYSGLFRQSQWSQQFLQTGLNSSRDNIVQLFFYNKDLYENKILNRSFELNFWHQPTQNKTKKQLFF